METVITRDTDIFREYLAVLDSRARDASPVSRLSAAIKLFLLRRELDSVRLESADEDVATLRREVDERLNRTSMRRFLSSPWGARLIIFLFLVVGQQLALACMALFTVLFVELAPKPKWWYPGLPYEQPVFLYIFIFLFFAVTPLLAITVLFGGRFFRSWRATLPLTIAIIGASIVGTALVVRGKPNPIERPMAHSVAVFAKDRGVNTASYNEWVEGNWLMRDPKFQNDYETFLRNGPGRWITARFNSVEDAAWTDSMQYMNEYIDQGQDPKSFSDWLKYYLERNRIYSEERLDQEVNALTAEPNQRFLGIWQVEPYLKERDQRIYRAYIGSVNISMKQWGLLWLAVLAVLFLASYLLRPAAGSVRRLSRRFKPRVSESISSVAPLSSGDRYEPFPEKRDLVTPPFFDTPYRIFSRVHRYFIRRVVAAVLVVFVFWGVVYAMDLSGGNENLPSQVDLMQDHQLLAGGQDTERSAAATLVNAAGQPEASGIALPEKRGESALDAKVGQLERRIDDSEYDTTKQIKEQKRLTAGHQSDIESLKNVTSQLQPLPDQLGEVGSRAAAAESRAELLSGDIAATKQQIDGVDQKVTTKLNDVETKATRAADDAGKAQEQTSVLTDRTEALEKELDRRARQIEAQTSELGDRTVALKEREEQLGRLQQIALTAVVAGIKGDTDELERRTTSTWYRLFNKNEARLKIDSLRRRVTQINEELAKLNTEEAKQLLQQLSEVSQQLDRTAERVK